MSKEASGKSKMSKHADEFWHAHCGGRLQTRTVFHKGHLQQGAVCLKCGETHRAIHDFERSEK